MDELPDYLPGYPPMYGVKQELPLHYQGDTLIIPIELCTEPGKESIVLSDYILSAYLKQSTDTEKVIWSGAHDNGIEVKEGKVFVKVKAGVARCIPSGTYYLAVAGATSKDPTNPVILSQTTISITPSAASPLPIVKAVPDIGFKGPGQPLKNFLPISYFF